MRRRTLGRSVSRASVGVHTGEACAVELRPGPWGAGLVFVTDHGEIPASLAHARAEPGATVLRCGSAEVWTVEHLLAALSALGVTDAVARVHGPEVPALDGSARGWVEAVDEAGRVDGPALEPLVVEEAVATEGYGGRATLGPGDSVGVDVDFLGGPTGRLVVPRSERAFREQIMWARTFALASEAEALRAAGRGRGASAENTVLWPDGPWRSPDEPVRHKLLDAWGDLALLGPARVAWHVSRGSHRLHLLALASR